MSIEDDIEELLEQAYFEDRGAKQYELTKKALHLAEKTKNEKIIFEVKIAHIESTTFYGKDDEALLNFVWCRNTFLEKMDEYSEYSFTLLWDYKWIIMALISNPKVSLEKIYEIIGDFNSFADKLNYSKRTGEYLKFSTLYSINDFAGASKYVGWQKLKKDSLCDCEACELNTMIEFYRESKKLSVAKKKFNILIKSKKSCTSVPLTTYASFLCDLIEEKDYETAKRYYENCHKEIMKNPDYLYSQSEILIYLVSINELSKALKCFEKQFNMTTIASSLKDKLKFYIASELLFKKMKKETRKKSISLKLKKNDVLFNKDNVWEIDELIEFFESKNKKLVSSFDARNRNKGEAESYERYKCLAGV